MAAVTERTVLLRGLEQQMWAIGHELAVFLVYERPSQVVDRPDLAKTFFAQRCVSDDQLDQMIAAYREIGAYVQLFEGEQPFLEALTTRRLELVGRRLPVVYNGIGFGITRGGFQPGRMALLPAITDSYGMLCANSDAYTCAFALHRFHSFVVLRSLGVQAPPVWFYRLGEGWMGDAPPIGTKVIAKNTYEAWSVGVTEDSVFVVDDRCTDRVAAIAEDIGQPVTLQQFVAGHEVCVPIVAVPERVVLPPVQQILAKAPRDPDAVMTIHDNLNLLGVDYHPFEGPSETVRQMVATSHSVFQILQQRALGRMDFRIDDQGQPWLTDAAITPGLGMAGSAFASFGSLGFSYPEFLRVVLATSLASSRQLEPRVRRNGG